VIRHNNKPPFATKKHSKTLPPSAVKKKKEAAKVQVDIKKRLKGSWSNDPGAQSVASGGHVDAEHG
jgi:hypothetical protein